LEWLKKSKTGSKKTGEKVKFKWVDEKQ
jgi:hypothetical protein